MKRPLFLKLKAIEKTKADISALRDRLRSEVEDLEGILESCDQAVDDLEDGIRAFQDAVDNLSKYL